MLPGGRESRGCSLEVSKEDVWVPRDMVQIGNLIIMVLTLQ